MNSLRITGRALRILFLALLLSLGTVVSTTGTATAAPTAEFTFSPTAPLVGQPVTFTFDGTCDVPPCSVDWRAFRDGGSSLGSSMGRGEVLTYTFTSGGIYSVVATITNATSTHGSASATHALRVQDTIQDDDRQVGYDGWRGVTDARGGHRLSTTTTNTASLGFVGTGVTYVARSGPQLGIAAVTVDGSRTLVDLYSPTFVTKSFPVTGLTDTQHRIRVQATGTRNPSSTGTAISVDEFTVGTTRVDDRSSAIDYDSWVGAANANASGGTLRNSSTAGAVTSATFFGPSVTWLTKRGPAQGLANVLIDGVRVATVDGYAATQTWQVPRQFTGLGAGRHVIRIVVVGSHNPSSTGNRVVSDAFVMP